jgi:hypothetical protein
LKGFGRQQSSFDFFCLAQRRRFQSYKGPALNESLQVRRKRDRAKAVSSTSKRHKFFNRILEKVDLEFHNTSPSFEASSMIFLTYFSASFFVVSLSAYFLVETINPDQCQLQIRQFVFRVVEFSVELKVAGLHQAHRCLAIRVIILVVGEVNVVHELVLVDSGGGVSACTSFGFFAAGGGSFFD